jgi:HEAT repeat protein
MDALVALALLIAADAPQEASDSEVRSLIEALGADKAEDRDRAGARLREKGRTALPALKKSAVGNGEAALRARDVARLIELDLALPERVRKALPKAADRLAAGEWGGVLLELTAEDKAGVRQFPDIVPEDLALLAAPALSHATAVQEKSDLCWVVGAWGLRSALPDVVRYLSDPEDSVREDAAHVLGQLKTRDAAGHLLQRLQDPNPSVRGAAARALGQMGAVDAAPALVERLKDRGDSRGITVVLEEPGMTVRDQAASALCLLNDRHGVAHLLENAKAAEKWSASLNAIRRRNAWGKLSSLTVKGKLEGKREDVLREVAKQAGMDLDLAEAGSTEERKWLSGKTRLDSLTYTLWDYLEWQSMDAPCDLLLEETQIRFLPRAKALEFWKAWHAGMQKE